MSASVMSSSKYTPRGVTTSLNSRIDETKTDILKAQKELEDEPSSSKVISFGRPTPPPSPPQEISRSTTIEEKLAENTVLSASTLKTRLGLDGWQCGSSRKEKKDPPCIQAIAKKKRDQIDSQIDSMVALTKSSPELPDELETLVMLVHCRYHNFGWLKDSRIDVWRKIFPNGTTSSAVLVEEQIREALGALSNKCIAIMPEEKGCNYITGGQKVENCRKTIDEIVRPKVYSNDANLDRLLTVLGTNMYCKDHKGGKPLEHVAQWKLSIVAIRKMAEPKAVQSVESDASEDLGIQTRAIQSQQSRNKLNKSSVFILPDRTLPTPRNLQSLSPEYDRDLTSFWPEAFDTTPFHIITGSNKLAGFQSSYKSLQSKITKELDEKEQKDGYVYLYEVEGNKGFLKIGYTSRSVEERHGEWGLACNRDPKTLYPISPHSVAIVPNARRVEALCHAELAHRRIKIYCAGCLTQHIEWFEVSAAEAIAVIQKWSAWMKTHPYQTIELRSVMKKTIKEEERLRTRDLNLFMKEISVAAMKRVA